MPYASATIAWPNQVEAADLLDVPVYQLNRATPEDAGVRDAGGRHYPPELFLQLALRQGIALEWAAARYIRFARKRLGPGNAAELGEINAAIERLRAAHDPNRVATFAEHVQELATLLPRTLYERVRSHLEATIPDLVSVTAPGDDD